MKILGELVLYALVLSSAMFLVSSWQTRDMLDNSGGVRVAPLTLPHTPHTPHAPHFKVNRHCSHPIRSVIPSFISLPLGAVSAERASITLTVSTRNLHGLLLWHWTTTPHSPSKILSMTLV